MSNPQFPTLTSALCQSSQKTLQTYAQVLGKVRRALTPPQRHWAHVSLRIGTAGLTTGPIAVGGSTFELMLNLAEHKLVITTSQGNQWHKPLVGQSAADFCNESLAALAALGIEPEIDRTLFADTTPGTYHRAEVETYWQALTQIEATFKQFKGKLYGETSPIQLWPHHIDLAFLWFSGRLIPGQDPADEEYADEQMNFGFSPGDDSIPDPYFYITAYPMPEGLTDTSLPNGATWSSAGFSGALFMYDTVLQADDPQEALLNFLSTVHQAGSARMR